MADQEALNDSDDERNFSNGDGTFSKDLQMAFQHMTLGVGDPRFHGKACAEVRSPCHLSDSTGIPRPSPLELVSFRLPSLSKKE